MAFVEIKKPELVTSTYLLALEFKNMEGCPGDRELQSTRMRMLREAANANEFRGAEWCAGICNGRAYRVNGKHTSTMIVELHEEGKEVSVPILLRKYACETMRDLANLYHTYDSKNSSRNKNDIIRAYCGGQELLQTISSKFLCSLSSGIDFARRGGERGHVDTGRQHADLLLTNMEFVEWIYHKMELKSFGGNTHGSHLMRTSTFAAMYMSYGKNPEKAEEFWVKVRDDCMDAIEAPTRVLHKYLISTKVAGGGTKSRAAVTAREMYVKCIHAWNAWRRGATSKLRYYETAEVPAVV